MNGFIKGNSCTTQISLGKQSKSFSYFVKSGITIGLKIRSILLSVLFRKKKVPAKHSIAFLHQHFQGKTKMFTEDSGKKLTLCMEVSLPTVSKSTRNSGFHFNGFSKCKTNICGDTQRKIDEIRKSAFLVFFELTG